MVASDQGNDRREYLRVYCHNYWLANKDRLSRVPRTRNPEVVLRAWKKQAAKRKEDEMYKRGDASRKRRERARLI